MHMNQGNPVAYWTNAVNFKLNLPLNLCALVLCHESTQQHKESEQLKNTTILLTVKTYVIKL